MRSKFISVLLGVLTIVLLYSSCKKEEGEGGRNFITGTIYYNLIDHNGKFISQEIASDHEVYISYGDHTEFDENESTGLDGEYSFEFMNAGNYTLTTFEDCDSCDSELSPVVETVKVPKGKGITQVPDIYLKRNIDIEDGTSSISGVLWVKLYNSALQIIGEYPGFDEWVYVKYGSDSTYFEKVKSSGDGSYEFINLIPGEYTIYSYSELAPQPDSPKWEIRTLETLISTKNQSVELGQLVIEEHI